MLDEYLQKRFVNKYKFCNHDINKFALLLRKGVPVRMHGCSVKIQYKIII